MLVRFAADCDPRGRDLAARAQPFLSSRDRVVAEYGLDGTPLVDHQHPVTLAAAAAAERAAGHRGAALALLDRAEALDHRHPSYYGSAWVALSRLMLTTRRLRTCGG